MSPGTEPTIEDRLRNHYAHLRDRPPVADPSRRRPPTRFLALAAGLAILIGGGAYLAERGPGAEPLQADVGADPDGLDGPIGGSDDADGEPADGDELPSGDAEPAPSPEPDDRADNQTGAETETEIGLDPTPDDAGASTADADRGDQAAGEASADGGNADGSPVAPTPGTELPPADAPTASAYGAWEPGRHDTCSKEIHDHYWVYGPDGKVYPTHHQPVDPATGCHFGHEHGRDPAGSDLEDIPFPFGYVNEQLVTAGASPRPESHVGHKVEWYNDGGYYEDGSSVDRHDQICDVAYKVHHDSHSAAAFDNHEHEVFVHARCGNGAELIYRALHPFGRRGEFAMHCDQGTGPTVVVGPGDGEGADRIDGREIPASACFEDRVLVPKGQRSDWFPFDERWTLYQSVDSPDFGRFFVQLQFFVDLPARYWDGDGLANTIDLCFVTGDLQVRDDEHCEPLRAADPGRVVAWDDPASPFDGSARSIFMGDLRLDNAAGQTDWYTDVNGGIWSPEPFPGSIRQHVGTTPIDAAASYRPDPIRSITFADDLGIHPPN
ncbi:MAG: hypothetical protein AAGA93_10585 [Actinomycetota bacterium]